MKYDFEYTIIFQVLIQSRLLLKESKIYLYSDISRYYNIFILVGNNFVIFILWVTAVILYWTRLNFEYIICIYLPAIITYNFDVKIIILNLKCILNV